MAKRYQGLVIDGTHGGRRGLWKAYSPLAGKFIAKEKIKPIRLRLLKDKKPIKLPPQFPGIPVPHVHHRGKIYQLSQGQWKRFSTAVVRDMKSRVGKIKTVNLDRLTALSTVIDAKK